MYLAQDNLHEKKYILYKPLEVKLKKRKISAIKKIFGKFFIFQDDIVNNIIDDYIQEQEFIKNNKEKIIKELNELDYRYFYTIEHSMNNYLIDYIRDYFEINNVGSEKESIYLERLKSFFYLNEVLFYIENNLAILAKEDNVIWIKSKAKYKDYYYRKWFAKVWDDASKKSIMSFTVFFNIVLTNDQIINELDNLSSFILDRLFFIHPDYTLKKYKNKNSYQYVYKLCRFFILLNIIKDNKISLNDNLIGLLEFNKDNFLNDLLENQKKLNILDRGLIVNKNEIYLVNTVDLQNILKSSLFQKYNNDVTKISREFGKLFEDYVHQYCKDHFSKDYEIRTETINCNDIEECKGMKLDIDMTIYDIKRNFYYFIQIKYTLISQPYLKDEIKAICDNKSFQNGIKQLKNFHIAITYKAFKDKLKEFNIKIKNNNYALILLHNTPQYDFQEIGDIKLYEWNTFRNLLDKGKQTVGNLNIYNPSFNDIQNNKTLELENVDEVIKTTIRNNPFDYNEAWNLFYSEYEDFKINNKVYLTNIK